MFQPCLKIYKVGLENEFLRAKMIYNVGRKIILLARYAHREYVSMFVSSIAVMFVSLKISLKRNENGKPVHSLCR